MFEQARGKDPQQPKPEKPEVHIESEEFSVPISKEAPQEVQAPPPQKADLKKIPGRKQVWLILSVVLGVIVVGVGGVFAAHMTGLIDIPVVDKILGRNQVTVSDLASYMSDIKSSQGEAQLDIAVGNKTEGAVQLNQEIPMLQLLPSDVHIQLNIKSTGVLGDDGVTPNMAAQISGLYEQGGTQLSADLEFRQVDGNTYARLNKAPAVPFFDLSQITDVWFELPSVKDAESQIGQFGIASPLDISNTTLDSKLVEDTYMQVFQSAATAGLVTISDRIDSQEFNNIAFDRYTVSLHKENIPAFIRTEVKALRDDCANNSSCAARALGLEAITDISDADIETLILEYEQDETLTELIDLLFSHTSYELWLAKDKTAYRILASSAIDISNQSPQLTGKQVKIQISSLVYNINAPLSITKPEEVTPFSDINRLLAGLSQSEWDVVTQKNQIDQIRTQLSWDKSLAGEFPESLDTELTDVFTGIAYPYAKSGQTYTLKYEMEQPEGNKLTQDDFDDFIFGTNTADKYVVSREAESARDTDKDGLSGTKELELGTDPLEADTDGDGFSDFDELQSETDPLDPDSKPEGEPELPVNPVVIQIPEGTIQPNTGGSNGGEKVKIGFPNATENVGVYFGDRRAFIATRTNAYVQVVVPGTDAQIDEGKNSAVNVRVVDGQTDKVVNTYTYTGELRIDTDGDGLTDEEEATIGTSRGFKDSDDDKIDDYDELQAGSNPLVHATDDVDTVSHGPGALFTSNEGTITFWTKAHNWNSASYRDMLNFVDSNGSEQLLVRKGLGYISFIVNNNPDSGAWSTSGATWKSDTWMHIAITWKANEVPKLYVDGTQLTNYIINQSTQLFTLSQAASLDTIGTLYLNGRPPTNDGENTLVSDVQILDSALTSAQITDLYTAGQKGADLVWNAK